MGEAGDRESKLLPADGPADPSITRAKREALNAVRQFDRVRALIQESRGSRFRLRPSHLLELNRLAIEGVNEFPGAWRVHPMTITGSKHIPPPHAEVPRLIEEMVDYVNDGWDDLAPVHLAAYMMWRINWIHPFVDGNGRTARAASYAVLCIRLGYELPGARTFVEDIANNKPPYYRALEGADEACQAGHLDVSDLEGLISALLARQLAAIHQQATGTIGAAGK